MAATPLFDGKTLGAWKPVVFGGEGEVSIIDGAIRLERGNDLTGVVWTGKLPGPSFRLQMEARRLDGSDFFCAVTVPVGGSHCTFVVGGWGGTVGGILESRRPRCLGERDEPQRDVRRSSLVSALPWT